MEEGQEQKNKLPDPYEIFLQDQKLAQVEEVVGLLRQTAAVARSVQADARSPVLEALLEMLETIHRRPELYCNVVSYLLAKLDNADMIMLTFKGQPSGETQ